MSRGIKFRVYDKTGDYYVAILDNDSFGIKQTARVILELEMLGHEYIVEQCTDLKDKNGKEIYEGDIVKFERGDQTPAEVVYQEGSYFLKAIDDGTLFYDPEVNKPCPLGWLETYGLEVIGNIREPSKDFRPEHLKRMGVTIVKGGGE